jgi:hypothetical protein
MQPYHLSHFTITHCYFDYCDRQYATDISGRMVVDPSASIVSPVVLGYVDPSRFCKLVIGRAA